MATNPRRVVADDPRIAWIYARDRDGFRFFSPEDMPVGAEVSRYIYRDHLVESSYERFRLCTHRDGASEAMTAKEGTGRPENCVIGGPGHIAEEGLVLEEQHGGFLSPSVRVTIRVHDFRLLPTLLDHLRSEEPLLQRHWATVRSQVEAAYGLSPGQRNRVTYTASLERA